MGFYCNNQKIIEINPMKIKTPFKTRIKFAGSDKKNCGEIVEK
jgi:hypothetical protein